MQDEEMVIVFTDDEGNEYYYREDMVIEMDDKRYAILIPIDTEDAEEDEEGQACGCGCDDICEEDVYIARIEVDENGEEVYVDPDDEEFERVRQAYEEILAEEEEEDSEA